MRMFRVRDHAPWQSRSRSAVSQCVLLVVLCTGWVACTGRSNRVLVFEESTVQNPLSADRAFAIRVTLFEFAESAGGFVEFYGIDGGLNTADAPYFAVDSCAYFGAGPIASSEFRIDVTGPMGGRLILQATLDSRKELALSVVDDDGLLVEESSTPWTLELVASDTPATRSCDAPQ
jgi:hypothetical protein